ncbi:hypothetical protein ACUN0C_13180 [Faunimonas sp. B44]|uniref:hypothetical protein n=1 Tax=Faunimonas sp. B44 TaxID=3461493 RepID=UPI004044D548
MSRRARGLAGLALLLGCGAAFAAAAAEGMPVPDRLAREQGLLVRPVTGAAEDFSRHCQGCHGHHGVSVDEVPSLKDRIGRFVHVPEGRAYLARVPGVAFAHLSDERLAGVLNWALRTYSASELPAGFVPYGAQEVGSLRRDPVNDVGRERAAVVDALVAAGIVADRAALAFGTDRRY